MEEHRKKATCEIAPVTYWTTHARARFPLLRKLALRLYYIPTSSASAERCWSIFSLVHNKLRNRLSKDKVMMLTYIYCNSNIVSADQIDFAEVIINGEDDVVMMNEPPPPSNNSNVLSTSSSSLQASISRTTPASSGEPTRWPVVDYSKDDSDYGDDSEEDE